MREVRVCSPCLLGLTQLRHNTTPFKLEFLVVLRSVSNARNDAKIIKFKMRVPSTASRNFRWRDKENGSAKVKVVFSNCHGCQEKNRTQKIIDLTYRPNLLPTVPPQTSPKEHKSLKTLPSKLIQVLEFSFMFNEIKVNAMKFSNLFSG